MIRKITKTELRKNIYHSENGKRIQLGFWVGDNPYFISYHISEFADKENFETQCVNAFLRDLKIFHRQNLKDDGVTVYYKDKLLC